MNGKDYLISRGKEFFLVHKTIKINDNENAAVRLAVGKTDSRQRSSPPCLDVAGQHYGDWLVPDRYPNKGSEI